MKILTNQTFASIFWVNFERPVNRRMSFLNQYISKGFGEEIKVIDHAIFRTGGICCIIIAEAASQEIFETALSPCKDSYYFNIYQVKNIVINASMQGNRYAVFAWESAEEPKHFTRNPEIVSAAVDVNVRIDIANEFQSGSVLLLSATSVSLARKYGEFLFPSSHVISMDAIEPEKYLAEKLLLSPNQIIVPGLLPVTANTESIESVPTLSLYNDDSTPNLVGNSAIMVNGKISALNYYDLFLNNNISRVEANQTINREYGAYIWKQIPANLNYTLSYSYNLPLGHGNYKTYYDKAQISTPSNAPAPVLFTPFVAGNTLGYSLENKPNFHARSPLLTWLNSIMHSDKYNADWPEEKYSSIDDKNAYKYFLTKLDGGIPMNGHIKPGIIEAIRAAGYPPNSNFSERSFQTVSSHLLFECTYFDYANDWFGGKGSYFYTIYTLIAIVSSRDLTTDGDNMQLNSEKTNIETTLDEIFSIIGSIVSLVPEVGEYFAAAIELGWSVAKIEIGSEKTAEPIQSTIADIADILNSYLENQINATNSMFNTVTSNWGKLQEFAKGNIEGFITPEQFEMPPGANMNKSKLPDGYLSAAAKAWKIIIYQMLFKVAHTPSVKMTITSKKPSNPWNPDKGKYEFIYYLDCIYPDSNGNPQLGYMEYHCTTDAPTKVMKILFGSNSELNINPLEFFIGFNGWPVIYPEYNLGNLGINGQARVEERMFKALGVDLKLS